MAHRHPLFSPSYVLPHNPRDEQAHVLGKRWWAAPRLPAPVQLETLTMPANESHWRHDGERFFPVKEPTSELETF